LATRRGEAAGVGLDWLLPLALTTSVLGVLGALAAHSLGRLVAYLTVSSVGTMLARWPGHPGTPVCSAVLHAAQHTGDGGPVPAGGADRRTARGDGLDRLQPAPSVREPVLLGVMLILGAASAAGLPPLPGFLGKVMMLQGASACPPQAWVWTVVLSGRVFHPVGLARAGVIVFWHVQPDDSSATSVAGGGQVPGRSNGGLGAGSSPSMVGAAGLFLAMSVLLSVAAAPVKRYTDATAAQWADQGRYASAVLGLAPGQPSSTTRPYDGKRPPATRQRLPPTLRSLFNEHSRCTVSLAGPSGAVAGAGRVLAGTVQQPGAGAPAVGRADWGGGAPVDTRFPAPGRHAALGPAIRLTGVVLWDIVVSNITVARLVLGPIDGMQPLWLKVPLASRHQRVNALFASIITTTPGTVSCVVDEDQSCIWVHAIHGTDGPAMVADMKQRYEQPLLHILGVQPEEPQP
jgi:hypothetical protein